MIIPKKPYLPACPINHFINFLRQDAVDDVMPLSLAIIVMLCTWVDALCITFLR